MVFDPIAMTWRGNEEELARFKSYTRPALIPPLNPATQPIGNNVYPKNQYETNITIPRDVRMDG